jgi:hypothetical protein
METAASFEARFAPWSYPTKKMKLMRLNQDDQNVGMLLAWCWMKFSAQRRSNSRGWLHRAITCKRHQKRHLVELAPLLVRQAL